MQGSAEIEEWLTQARAALEAGDAAAAQAAAMKIRDGINALGAADESAGDLRASLGHLLYRAGAHDSAVDELKLAIEQQALRYGEVDYRVARSHRIRGMAFMGLRRADDAIKEIEAAAHAHADSAAARLEVGYSAALLGHLHLQDAQADKALPALRRALEMLPPGVSELESLRTPAEDDLGYAFLLLDRLDAAEYILERASERAKTQHGAVSLEYAERLWKLAQLYGRQHRLAYGAECARRCVAIRSQLLQSNDTLLGRAHLTLAAILNECAEWSAAREHFERAFHILRSSSASGMEYLLAHIGVLHAAVKSGEGKASEEALETLLEVGNSLRAGADRALVQALVDLASIKEQKGDRDASRALVTRAHEAGRLARSSELNRIAFLDLARLQVKLGSAADAVTALEWVANLDSGLAERLASTYHFPQRILYSDALADVTSELVRLVLEHLPDSQNAARVALRVVLARKALLTEADIAHNRTARALKELGVDEHLARIDTLRAQLRALLSEGPGDGHRKLWAALKAKKQEIREAESQLAGALDDQPAIYSVPTIDLERLATQLATDEVLLEFCALREPRKAKPLEMLEPDLLSEVQTQRYVVFVLEGGSGTARLIDLGDAEPIERLIYSYIAAVHPNGAEEVSRDRRAELEAGNEQTIGARLRERLFDPIAPLLQGASRLRLAPDGAIAAVSFALLPLADGSRLIDHFELSYLSCGRVLLGRAAPEDGGASDPLVVADPDFDVVDLSALLAQGEGPQDFYFERLPRSAEEGARVIGRVGGTSLSRERASVSSLLGAKSPAVLHLATHGYFLPAGGRGLNVIGNWRAEGFGLSMRGDVLASADEPLLRSGLALCGVNAWSAGKAVDPSMGDGLLTALEVTRLDLRLTELVVLSACSAARGSVRPGEGSAGLLQAFEAAGARRVVAALWALADHPATVTLVDTFYAEVLAGSGAATALRRSQRYLKRLGAPPWVWGALVAYGDRSPLQWRPPGNATSRGSAATAPAVQGART